MNFAPMKKKINEFENQTISKIVVDIYMDLPASVINVHEKVDVFHWVFRSIKIL